nr:isoprenylcysteine carboxylmethyltransferase family protein [uncultured Blautia sp.]
MGDPTKFNYIWEYDLFNFALLMLSVSEIFIFVYTYRKKDGKEISRDRGTKWLLYLNFIVCILISFYNVSKKAFNFIRMMKLPGFCIELGICLMLLGIVIRVSAVLTLRKAFTLNVQVTSRQRLITSGLYRKIRHPAYTGSILSLLGIALALRDLVSVGIVLVCCLVCYQIRIAVEEVALEIRFKEEYILYKHNTYKLFPYIF